MFAGKIVRLNLNGSIPSTNIWYGSLSGDLRAIIALGQRNPICLTRHPVSGKVYVNGFTGSNKYWPGWRSTCKAPDFLKTMK